MIDPVHIVELAHWGGSLGAETAQIAVSALEHGKLLVLPKLGFRIEGRESALLTPEIADGRAKNIAFHPETGSVAGSAARGLARDALGAMLRRFSGQARALVSAIAPDYARALRWGMTSFRPHDVASRTSSSLRDDRRLHVDAFVSRPTQGERILRVFSNIDPRGAPRVWEVGSDFAAYAARFAPGVRPQWPGSARLRHALHITKSRRTAYDHLMLALHDRAKRDAVFQATAARVRVELPAGTTWVAFTDCVPHAALSGQFLLEQTFLLPVGSMRDPALSPLRQLEAMTGRQLVRQATSEDTGPGQSHSTRAQ
jgi:hypothetical protein